MKFNMALNMMDMVGVVYSRLADVKFPFLVMHDPEDGEISEKCGLRRKPYDKLMIFLFCFEQTWVIFTHLHCNAHA